MREMKAKRKAEKKARKEESKGKKGKVEWAYSWWVGGMYLRGVVGWIAGHYFRSLGKKTLSSTGKKLDWRKKYQVSEWCVCVGCVLVV